MPAVRRTTAAATYSSVAQSDVKRSNGVDDGIANAVQEDQVVEVPVRFDQLLQTTARNPSF